jgi:hypothetical protein
MYSEDESLTRAETLQEAQEAADLEIVVDVK